MLRFPYHMQWNTHTHKHAHTHTHTHKHTLSPGLLWKSDKAVQEATSYTVHNKQKRQLSMNSAGLGPAISAIKRLQTYVIDDMATGHAQWIFSWITEGITGHKPCNIIGYFISSTVFESCFMNLLFNPLKSRRVCCSLYKDSARTAQ